MTIPNDALNDAILRRRAEGQTFAAIAAALGMSPKRVNSAYYRTVKRMQKPAKAQALKPAKPAPGAQIEQPAYSDSLVRAAGWAGVHRNSYTMPPALRVNAQRAAATQPPMRSIASSALPDWPG